MGEIRSTHGDTWNEYKILARKLEGKKHSCRWEDNIKMDLQELKRADMGWIHLVQYKNKWRRLVNTVMNVQVP
jgi:hypothetical protein